MMGLPIRKEDIIRIEALDLPEVLEKGEGVYEWRCMDTKFYVDIIALKKELKEIMPGREEDIADRLQNFRKVFINTATGEVST